MRGGSGMLGEKEWEAEREGPEGGRGVLWAAGRQDSS